MSNQLLIIGNGFDLTHRLNTRYTDFYDNFLSEDVKNKWFDVLNNANIGEDWYSFEERIGSLTVGNWFEKYHGSYINMNPSGDALRKKLETELEEINCVFNQLTKELYVYIKQEDEKEKETILKLVNEIDREAQAISFNYTSTASLYVRDVQHIHGSIMEENIILGYKLRPEFNGIYNDAAKFSKVRLRDKLMFSRTIPISTTDLEYKEYIDVFEKYANRSYSGRGLYFEYSENTRAILNESEIYNDFPNCDIVDEELYQLLKRERVAEIPRFVDDYLEKFRETIDMLPITVEFNRVTHLKILGHSLEADTEIFEYLFSKLVNLESVDLYTYEGESKSDIEDKMEFLNQYIDIQINELSYS